MYRLVSWYAPPEYATVFLTGGIGYPLDPAVEVFVYGIILGQLVDCWLRPAGMPDDEYLKLLASGQYQLLVSLHASALCLSQSLC